MTLSQPKLSLALAVSLLISACGNDKVDNTPASESSSPMSISSSSMTPSSSMASSSTIPPVSSTPSSSSIPPVSSSSPSVPSSSSSAPASSSSPAVSVDKDDSVVLFAINSGGGAYTAKDGTKFMSDRSVSGGKASTTVDYIQGTEDQDLFKTERWGEFSYSFPVKPGTYAVTLYVAEGYFGQQKAGNRVFDVNIEDTPRVDDFDPLAAAGHDKAHTIEIKDIVVNDGELTLDFIPSVDQASIRGIVVHGPEGNGLEIVPVISGTVGSGPVPSDCPSTGSLSDNDFVLFDGGKDIGPVKNSAIELHHSWMLDQVWAANQGAKIEIVNATGGSAIQYSNAGVFTGFKFLPPFGNFNLSGIDLYIEGSSAQFGLRITKPGEFQGNGGASTTTWARDKSGKQDLALSNGCSLLSLSMPNSWSPNQAANLMILEVKNGWNNSSKLRIRRMVLKGFKSAE